MSVPDEDDPEAGEYVLGTLDAAERSAVAARREGDAALDARIASWENRLAPLLAATPEIDPPQHIFPALLARLFGAGSLPEPHHLAQIRRLDRRVRLWRAATAGCAALAAALLAWIAVPAQKPEQNFVAVLQKDANSPAILLDVDVGARRLTIRPLATTAQADKSYELWLINPALGAPRSLGTLSPNGATRTSLASFDPGTIEAATYAVTLEPVGGSPTGAPSGAPIPPVDWHPKHPSPYVDPAGEKGQIAKPRRPVDFRRTRGARVDFAAWASDIGTANVSQRA